MGTAYFCSECGHEVTESCEAHPSALIHSTPTASPSALISLGGAPAIPVERLPDERVTEIVELIGNDTDDAVRESAHSTGASTEREYLEAYCTIYKATHGTVYATP